MTETKNALTTFTFTNAGIETKVRVVEIDGNPWFVANDLPQPLGFTFDNLKYHLKVNVRDDERGVAKLPTVRGMQPHTVVAESGLYKLIMRSDKPEARKFQDWVTREVLPSIRKNGGYIMGQEKLRTGEMSELELLARAQLVAQKVIEGLTAEIEKLAAARRVLALRAVENAVMHKELHEVTIDEYRAHSRLAQSPTCSAAEQRYQQSWGDKRPARRFGPRAAPRSAANGPRSAIWGQPATYYLPNPNASPRAL